MEIGMRRAGVCDWLKWPSVNPPLFRNEYKPNLARYHKACRGFHVEFHPHDFTKTQKRNNDRLSGCNHLASGLPAWLVIFDWHHHREKAEGVFSGDVPINLSKMKNHLGDYALSA